ncbi:DNA adenine methylase [Anaerobacillus isosaccharinicus]|uniref:DNA adenine methylase n=1 Tax=Anaerobacillus isosaccharinicus TaxID=1532552 RepID=A0A1S2MD99_9BACI|nr:DNA adenine methylase [Anaerobacillus isosaccharinicus]MBA5588877.1 DNA adenine methylase [Anaerobacillus isosaccharinicus]QOY37736.1 DNA adenine methylase [Anaerobacillus isosaccharinicus]
MTITLTNKVNISTHHPIRWFGGKAKLSRYLLPLMPKHKVYVEPFGGGGAILTKKERSLVEVYNDIDDQMVNFLLVLRNERERLIKAVQTLPSSRTLFVQWKNEPIPDDPFEAAVRWFYLMQQRINPSNGSGVKSGWRSSKVKNVAFCYQNAIQRLEAFADRMNNVMIECRDFREIIQFYDTEQTLMLIDPPYYNFGKCYLGNFEHNSHVDLAHLLNNVQSKVILTYYSHPVIEQLYKGWHRFEIPNIATGSVTKLGQQKSRQTEVIFTNYNPFVK